eukprot:4414987-Alexandrium_andersonii.AAC.1
MNRRRVDPPGAFAIRARGRTPLQHGAAVLRNPRPESQSAALRPLVQVAQVLEGLPGGEAQRHE